MEKLVECVPNFSEGRDQGIIDAISSSITSVEGAKLLDVDPGADTNRTVITFVGSPENALEAAFQAIKTASQVIDMTTHKGAHARMGATDVCPFVPVSGLSMDECIQLAQRLGKRVGEELKIPVYLYEYAATSPERQNLATIRKGEYEGLEDKLQNPNWKPDFGPDEFNKKSGATVIGARKFLIAYNVNVNSRNQRLAHNIALDIRERGRWLKDKNRKIIKDEKGNKLRKDGLLKECKAVGWLIEEYDRAQISMNLTDFEITPPHKAFEACVDTAHKYGLRVTGSELVGLIPLDAMLQTGRYYLEKQEQSTGIPERQIIDTAIQSLGLNEIAPFNPNEKIIEYRVANPSDKQLMSMRCSDFVDELSTDSPAPGGGSVASLCGSLAAGLAAMVANLTADKREYEGVKKQMIKTADHAQILKEEFVKDVDRDTAAFNQLMDCFGMPKKTKEQAKKRSDAITTATKHATLIPFTVLERTLPTVDCAKIVADSGNQNSLSDAGVAAIAARAAAEGAFLNVMINLEGIKDTKFVEEMRRKATDILNDLRQRVETVMKTINQKLHIEI